MYNARSSKYNCVCQEHSHCSMNGILGNLTNIWGILHISTISNFGLVHLRSHGVLTTAVQCTSRFYWCSWDFVSTCLGAPSSRNSWCQRVNSVIVPTGGDRGCRLRCRFRTAFQPCIWVILRHIFSCKFSEPQSVSAASPWGEDKRGTTTNCVGFGRDSAINVADI